MPRRKMPAGGMTNTHDSPPYMKIVDDPRATHGKGSTQPTIFGVIGRTKLDPYMASLQDLVMNSKTPGTHHAPVMSDMKILSHHENTERRIIGHRPATHYAGHIHGQVPYPGGYAGGC
jgi:hypothetical protein